MEAQIFTVRAMPAQGHERRWCARRPFTREPVQVRVVEHPKPNVMKDGKIVEYSYEMDARDLEELKADPHIALSIAGSADADPLELNAAKAEIIELKKKLEEARKEHQGEIEDLKAARAQSAKLAEEMGAKVVLLEQQLASANEAIAKKALKK